MAMQSLLFILLSHSKQHAVKETTVVVLNVAGKAIESETNPKYEFATVKDNKFKPSINGFRTHDFPISLSLKT